MTKPMENKLTSLQALIAWGDKRLQEDPPKLLSFAEVIDQAESLLELEKIQIQTAYLAGLSDARNNTKSAKGDLYYNQNYGNKKTDSR